MKGLLLGGCWSVLVALAGTPARYAGAGVPGQGPGERVAACDSVPAVNRRVLAYVASKLKKRVGTGQCWDLAAEALTTAHATRNGQYVFGKPVDYRTACVFPGDVMQFEGVVIRYKKDGMDWQETMGHHTAVIYQVTGPGAFVLAHQNFGPAGKKVGLTTLELKNVQKGKYTIFRPQPGP